jgi:hypothetical protein
MDAATPFRRLRHAAGVLLLATGCAAEHTALNDASSAARQDVKAAEQGAKSAAQFVSHPTARPQMPTDPIPGSPVTPAAPVAGRPVSPAQATPVSFSPGRDKLGPALPTGDPRIKMVAIVGAGNIVTDEEVWEATRQRAGEYLRKVDGQGGPQILKDEAKEKEVYRDELRRVIERELILNEMSVRLKKANKLAVIDEIKEFAGKAADRRLREMGWKPERDEAFRSLLLAQGLTLPVIRRQLERQMMAEEYVRSMLKEKASSIGLTDVRAYFDQHPDEFRTPDRVRWQHIFISLNKFPTPREAYDYALAIQQHAATGADFAELSRKYDHGFSGMKDGTGLGEEHGKIEPKDVEPTVWALKAGEVSGLIETPAGYHIVRVAEREYAGVRPFDETVQKEVRGKLMRQLQDREYRRMVEDLWWKGVARIIEVP